MDPILEYIYELKKRLVESIEQEKKELDYVANRLQARLDQLEELEQGIKSKKQE